MHQQLLIVLVVLLYLDPQYAVEVASTHDRDMIDVVACAADPAHPQAVFVASNVDRHVHELYWTGTAWAWTFVTSLAGDRPTAIACGDGWPGNGTTPELYVSHRLTLRMVAWDGTAWVAQPVLAATTSIPNKAAVGDIDPTLAGPEVYFSSGTTQQAWWNGSAWVIASLPGTNGLYVATGDADPDVVGDELYTTMTTATRQFTYASGWRSIQIASVGTKAPQNAIRVGDADDSLGNEVLVNWHQTDRSGKLWAIRKSGASWVTELVFQVGAGTAFTVHHFHNLEIGEFDNSHAGAEIIMSWSPQTHSPGRISVFGKTAATWTERLIWEDLDEMHGIALVDIDPRHPGLELVAVGHAPQVLTLRNLP